MGREADDGLAPGQPRAAPDLGTEGVEYQAVDGPGASVEREQPRQVVLRIVRLGQLEDGLAGSQRQPDHCADSHVVVPLDFMQQPGRGNPGEFRRRGPVDVESRTGVLLEVGRCHLPVDLALDRPAHDGRLVLAGGEDGDLARFHDGGDTHGDRLPRHVVLAKEVGRGVLPGDGVERDQPGAAVETRAGLIESDMAGLADAEYLEVDPAGLADGLLIPGRVAGHVLPLDVPAGDVDLGGSDVDVVEQVLVHVAVVRMDAAGRHRVIFIEVEGLDVLERQPFLAVHPDELAVDTDRCRTGGESQYRPPALGSSLADEFRDPAGDPEGQRVGVLHDVGVDALGIVHGASESNGVHPVPSIAARHFGSYSPAVVSLTSART